MAIDAETCLWERFGDQLFDQELALPKTVWESFSISRLEAPFMDLCDLANLGTRAKLRVDLTALMNEDLSVPQEWGLAIQLHPSNVAGIKYKSRFSSSACVALFERNGIAAQIKAEELGPLTLQPEALAWLEKRQVSLV